MIKKVLVLMMVCALLLPAQAMANDGGADFNNGTYRIDNSEFLQIKATPLTDIVQIGGNFKFELELTNLSTDNIDLVEINKVFSTCYNSISFDKNNSIIEPGNKITLIIETEVPYNIDWYIIDNNYYVDFDLSINYSVFEYIKNFKAEIDIIPYYGHDSTSTTVYPLRISNIKDGSKYLNLSIKEDDCIFNFIENSPFYSYYTADLKHHLILENKSTKNLLNIFIKDQWSHGECEIFNLSKENIVAKEVNTVYTTTCSDIESIMSSEYKVIFQIDDQYYATMIKEEFPAIVTLQPEVEFSVIVENVGDQNIKRLQVVNSSDEIYEDFFITAKDNGRISESDLNKHPAFALNPRAKHIISLFYPDPYDNVILFGFIEDGKLYVWLIESNKEFTSFSYQFRKVVDISQYEENAHSTIESLPATAPTPLPTAKPPFFDSPDSPTPIPPVTASPAIEITSVEKSSSIPIWVWIILPAAIVCAGLLIFYIRKKFKSQDE